MKYRILFVILIACLLPAGCATLEMGIEDQPTPDQAAIGTLAALMLQGTQYSAEATRLALPITPTAVTGRVNGQLCYPSERIPPMKIYFRSASDVITVLESVTNQARFSIDLPPGDYIAFGWVTEYQLGGLYSQAVVCGGGNSCTDHSPVIFQVNAGQTLTAVDICDWPFPAASLPVPTGFSLP